LILAGIKRSADIARRHNVIMTLEPLYRAGPDRPAIHTAATAFDIVDTLNDPNVRVCFDVFHLQLNEGNLTNNLKLGLEKGWIRMVQTGDVPGRKEPGTGEINHVHLLRTLREIGYAGYVDTEHGTSTTADETIEFCKRLVAQA
jgi:hydroxypyruvate isomerase